MERILKLTKPMMRGQARQDIRDVQQKLTDLGYPCGPADGIFGPKTLQSVKSFQKDFNLQVDGMVGPHKLGLPLFQSLMLFQKLLIHSKRIIQRFQLLITSFQ